MFYSSNLYPYERPLRSLCQAYAGKLGLSSGEYKRKLSFGSAVEAEEFQRGYGSDAVPYLCPHCRMWHLGSPRHFGTEPHILLVVGSYRAIEGFFNLRWYPRSVPAYNELRRMLLEAADRPPEGLNSFIREAVNWIPPRDVVYKVLECTPQQRTALYPLHNWDLSSFVLRIEENRLVWRESVNDYFDRPTLEPDVIIEPDGVEAIVEAEPDVPAPSTVCIDEKEELLERWWRANDLCHERSWSVLFPRNDWVLEIIYAVDEKDFSFNRKKVESALACFEKKLLKYSEDRRFRYVDHDKCLQALAYLRGETNQI